MGETENGFYQASLSDGRNRKTIRPLLSNVKTKRSSNGEGEEKSKARRVEEETKDKEEEEKEDEEFECKPCWHIPPPEPHDPGCEQHGTRKVQRVRAPDEPTAEERADHEILHVPYRSWCPECVSAAGKASPHRQQSEEERAVPGHHLDYWFMRDGPSQDSVPVVVMKDASTKTFAAHVCQQKGNVEWVAERICEDLDNIGHPRVSLKSDQEPALVDLIKEVKAKRDKLMKETILENSKAYDSQSNGTAERAVQSVERIVRTHKLALEKKLQKRIPSTHPVMTWLVEHGVDILNKFLVGADGRTAYERGRGKSYKGEMYQFGRKIFHMHPGKHSGGSMKPRWSTGIFLGKLYKSDEAMVYTEDHKVVKVRSIKLLPESESWDANAIQEMKVARWKAQLEECEQQLEEDESLEKDLKGDMVREKIPRDFHIRRDHLGKVGFAAGCPSCRSIMQDKNPIQHHSVKYRERIRELLGGRNVKKAKERQDEYISKQVRAASEGGRSALYGGDGVPGSSGPKMPDDAKSIDVPETTSEDKNVEEAAVEIPVPDDEEWIAEEPPGMCESDSGEEGGEQRCRKREKEDAGKVRKRARKEQESSKHKRTREEEEQRKRKKVKKVEEIDEQKEFDDFFNEETLFLGSFENVFGGNITGF